MFMFMLISNEPIKVTDLQKLASQLMLNGILVIEMISNSFLGSKKNFGRLIDHILQRGRVGSKPVTKSRYWNKFLVSECILKLIVIVGVAGYQRLVVCVRYIAETSLNRYVTVGYLKKQLPELFCRKKRS